jgi:phosphopantetheinyl transferase (holo-ACP synthase)
VRLTGLAARLAADAGITTLAVSVTHEPTMAAACVVAMGRDDGMARQRMPRLEQKGS